MNNTLKDKICKLLPNISLLRIFLTQKMITKESFKMLPHHSSVDKIFYNVKMSICCSHMKCCNQISAGLRSNTDGTMICRINRSNMTMLLNNKSIMENRVLKFNKLAIKGKFLPKSRGNLSKEYLTQKDNS